MVVKIGCHMTLTFGRGEVWGKLKPYLFLSTIWVLATHTSPMPPVPESEATSARKVVIDYRHGVP